MANFPYGYALLVGVGRHQVEQLSLATTVSDVQGLEKLLRDPERCAYQADHVKILHDEGATKQAILDGLKWLKQCALQDKRATVVIYYSGHGVRHESSETYYLVPHDGVDEQTRLSASDFRAALDDINPQRLLVILDCCHAAGMQAKGLDDLQWSKSAPSDRVLGELKQGSGRAVFSSSQSKQQSYIRSDRQMSIFTYHLLEALQGADNKGAETEITVANLMHHLGKTVAASAREVGYDQSPMFKLDAEDFPVALIRAGNGFAKGSWSADAEEAHAVIDTIAPPTTTITTTVGSITSENSNISIGNQIGGNLTQSTQSGGVNASSATFGNNAILSGRDLYLGTANVSGGTVHGSVVGMNTGTLNDHNFGRDDKSSGKTIFYVGNAQNVVNSPQPVNNRAKPMDQESIRLDVAYPENVMINTPFEMAVQIRQPDDPPLEISDLNSTASSLGEVYREKRTDIVHYRVDIEAENCDVNPKTCTFQLIKGKRSPIEYFRIIAKRLGTTTIIVRAFQDDVHLAATERIVIQVEVGVQANAYALTIQCPDTLYKNREHEITVYVTGLQANGSYFIDLKAANVETMREQVYANNATFYLKPPFAGPLNLNVKLYDSNGTTVLAQKIHPVIVKE